MGATDSSRSRCSGGVEPMPRTVDGKPRGEVPMGPLSTVVTGLAFRLSAPARCIRPIPDGVQVPADDQRRAVPLVLAIA